MNGFIAAAKILNEHPAMKIIFLTNYDTPAFRMKAAELHAAGYVLKENLSDLIPLIYH
jgi:DNA-binding NarL/FixJ family response regulator